MGAPIIAQDDIGTLSARFEDAYPQDILAWAAETYGDRLAIVTSFQPTGIVTLHMLQAIAPDLPILTLDTGLLFPETYALMDQLSDQLHINIRRVRPVQTVEQQAAQYGPALWEREPDACCELRKVRPLTDALAGHEAWVTGLRRDQSARRANTPIVSWDEKHDLVKLCPFATWTESMIWTYIQAHDLPYNTLHDQGYPTIGCYTCTRAVAPGDDPRAGRWSSHTKTECGIHLTEEQSS
jgi:phosphoadenosine phosphosulfate reductase